MLIVFPVAIVSGIGVLAGVILTFAARFMAVPVDERFPVVREALPGANCGACGFAGCDEYAQKLIDEGVPVNLCTPGGASTAEALGGLLGRDAGDVVPMRAVIHCSGTDDRAQLAMDYRGPQTCEACSTLYSGQKTCPHACMGFGDCAKACQYDAICLVNGVAYVDPELCTGCSMCVRRCPHHIISLVPKTSAVTVDCSSTQNGAVTRKSCTMGCIGCRKCEKTCEYDAVHVENNLAKIDPDKCVACGACVEACPTKVIHVTPVGVEVGAGSE